MGWEYCRPNYRSHYKTKIKLKQWNYWNRIFKAYVLGRTSQLNFWHGEPKIETDIKIKSIGPYYMSFHEKAYYKSYLDNKGIPMLDYQGAIGLQYNPIAISQWGLGNYNLWYKEKEETQLLSFIKCADWLVENLELNKFNFKVWMHHFDFEYRDKLKSPWYSGLAQGQGISLLVRAFSVTKEKKYSDAAHEAFKVFNYSINDGGVNYKDEKDQVWIEEYIVFPPTHILNGFIWGSWGVYDYALQFKDDKAMGLFNLYIKTLLNELDSFDNGSWSLYEHSGTWLKMIASPFYHKLHIVQLKVMFQITSESFFLVYANKWQKYESNLMNRIRAIIKKAVFKVFYY